MEFDRCWNPDTLDPSFDLIDLRLPRSAWASRFACRKPDKQDKKSVLSRAVRSLIQAQFKDNE